MKALIKTKNSLSLENIDNLTTLKSEYVRIKVQQVGLCRTDLYVANGTIPINKDIILGHEFSGYIYLSEYPELPIGSKVSVNPYFENNLFMGLDFDGALVEFIDVHYSKVFKSNNTALTYTHLAYLEPIAASMAPILKIKDKNLIGAVYGKNRIAELTYLILKSLNYNIIIIDNESKYANNSFDYIIETTPLEQDIQKICQLLKHNGQLIIKSRKNVLTGLNFSYLVTKELNLTAVNYYDFSKALDWLDINYQIIDPLFGEIFNFDNWEEAFHKAMQSDSKKIFIEMN